MTDSPDYPAAHSMDTSWFAIDNDGNVAIFESGEAGCVPESAYLSEPWDLEEALRALPATGFRFDPDGYRATQWIEHVEVDENFAATNQLYMFVSDLVPLSDLLARLDAEPMEATTCKAVRIFVRDRAAFAELHAREACLGCFRNWGGAASLGEIAGHGVYRYDHTCENWISGPYARATVPVKPLTLDQIPQAVRDKAIAYDGRFSETQQLQPAELWRCTSWESGWLALDGVTARPFEGRDMQDIEAAGDLDDDSIKWLTEPLEIPPPKQKWWK